MALSIRSLSERRPIHPAIVHLPLGLWAACLISDIVYFVRQDTFYPQISGFCLILGVIGGLVAAGFGFSDYLRIPSRTRAKAAALSHMILNVAAIVLFLASYVARIQDLTVVPAGGFILFLIGMGVISVSAYLGGTLVYEHGIGVSASARNPEVLPPESVPRPIRKAG